MLGGRQSVSRAIGHIAHKGWGYQLELGGVSYSDKHYGTGHRGEAVDLGDQMYLVPGSVLGMVPWHYGVPWFSPSS